jgi:hypothetical protein
MKVPEIYALYLPQFHRVKENDLWWGEGFTEWETVKNAKPFFEGHNQPLQPMDCYDLLDKHVMQEQADYMKRYEIDGMCFYHYYFENGKKILEKPAENLLEWTDINMPFCFYWANESWVRSWSNIAGNCWTEAYESSKDQNERGILLKQDYGGKKEWEEHFRYILPFFKDERYLKKDGKPIFIIYSPDDIECLEDMKKCWDDLVYQAGFPGIYYIGKSKNKDILDAVLIQEPQAAMRHKFFQNDKGIRSLLDYDEVWSNILSLQIPKNEKKEYLCGFPGYDDTPRHGKNGTVVTGATPEKFKNYMIRLLLKANRRDCDFLFLNAWNEWGEGMYLEPDRKWEFQYLEAIKEAKEFVEQHGELILAASTDDVFLFDYEKSEIERLNDKCNKYNNFFKVFERMLNLQLDGKFISKYILDKKYKSVAIYGLGVVGKSLVKVLENESINIVYGIDRDEYKDRSFKFPVYTLQEKLENIDLVIVTVEDEYSQIKSELEKLVKADIVKVSYLLGVSEGKYTS